MKKDMKLYNKFNGIGNPKYEKIVEYQPNLKNVITFSESMKYPVHNWFYYKQGFSPELVEKLLLESNLRKEATVLDPFCGVGTTLLTAKKLGYNSIGIDILPLATFISKVKLNTNYNVPDIKKNIENIINKPFEKAKTTWPDVKIIHKAFTPKMKNEISPTLKEGGMFFSIAPLRDIT